MVKGSRTTIIQVERVVLFNFAVLILSIIGIPLLQPTRISLTTLGIMIFLNILIALCYGMFIVRYEPPVGKRLFALLQKRS